jgi:hypothetical protein
MITAVLGLVILSMLIGSIFILWAVAMDKL